jgi:hypothetical protein
MVGTIRLEHGEFPALHWQVMGVDYGHPQDLTVENKVVPELNA